MLLLRENSLFTATLKAHDVVAGVDVDGFAGDTAGEVGGEVGGGVADFSLLGVAVERGAFSVGLQHVGEASDAARGQGLDRPGGDGVDANVLPAEIGGEVADRGF